MEYKENVLAKRELNTFGLKTRGVNDCFFVDIQVLREKQMSVSRDLEEKQVTCQQLQTSADELEVQIDTLSEERQRVS